MTLAALAVGAALTVGLALTAPVSRDEHMYQAAAALLPQQALYDAFVFPQPPVSAWFYAAVQAAWPGPEVLLPARLAQAVVSLGLGLVLWGLLRRQGAPPLPAASLLLLLVHTEVLRESLGLARNDVLALALSLSPWLLLPVHPGDDEQVWRLVTGGALAGLGLACRLTHAPLTLLAVAWPLLAPTTVTGGRREAGWIALGAVLVLGAVTAALWGTDLAALRFSLVDYHLLNARFHAASGLGEGLDLAGKLHDAGRLCRRTDLAAWSALVLVALVLVQGRGRAWSPTRWRLGLLVMVCGVVMVAVPRPVQNAYYATLLIGGALLVAAAMARLVGRPHRVLQGVLAVAVLVGLGNLAASDVAVMREVLHPSHWPAVQIHAAGRRLDVAMGEARGPVIATHPLYVLEAGRQLDPAFAAGEFVWRLGPVLRRVRVGRADLVTDARLAAHAAAVPPAAVLMVVAAPWDRPLGEWARARRGQMWSVAGGVVLWTPPPGVRFL
ncbi:MAG: hypothetical protein R3D98_00385 [Candidatus Krumholzibacteriia bacterium]